MKGIRDRASQLAAFIVLPREACSNRGLRARLHLVRMQWEELTWGLPERVGLKIAWLFGRPVRRWRRSQGRYDVGTTGAPMTVWEMRRALKDFDPHAPIVVDAPNSNGRAVKLGDWMLASGTRVAVLAPDQIEYEAVAVRAMAEGFTYVG
jgi:hypothetical protein